MPTSLSQQHQFNVNHWFRFPKPASVHLTFSITLVPLLFQQSRKLLQQVILLKIIKYLLTHTHTSMYCLTPEHVHMGRKLLITQYIQVFIPVLDIPIRRGELATTSGSFNVLLTLSVKTSHISDLYNFSLPKPSPLQHLAAHLYFTVTLEYVDIWSFWHLYEFTASTESTEPLLQC